LKSNVEEFMTRTAKSARGHGFGANDLGLMGVVVIWGLNLTVIKFAIQEVRPLAFNAARFTLAAVILLLLLRLRGESFRTGRRDLVALMAAGVMGHTAYQVLFIEGIARTTASHAALIFGISPVVVAILSSMLGHERIGTPGWGGAALAFGGVYIIIAGTAPSGGPAPSMTGDLLVLGAAVTWCIYTVMAHPLLTRHSPLKVTALSLGWGVLLMLPFCAPSIARQDWRGIGTWGWIATLYSSLFALVVAYLLWYRSVKKVGNVRTAVYSNLVPVTGTLAGWIFLGEPLYPALAIGAVAIFCGIALTRWNLPQRGIAEPADTGASADMAATLGEEY
jgi:drug/metabolite transporter (DMT)-like permease